MSIQEQIYEDILYTLSIDLQVMFAQKASAGYILNWQRMFQNWLRMKGNLADEPREIERWGEGRGCEYISYCK